MNNVRGDHDWLWMNRDAVLELIASLEVDNTSTSDDGESYMTLGNVSTSVLRQLGFDVPKVKNGNYKD